MYSAVFAGGVWGKMFTLQQVLRVQSYWVCCGDELKPPAWLTSASGLSEPLSILPQELMCTALAEGFALGFAFNVLLLWAARAASEVNAEGKD